MNFLETGQERHELLLDLKGDLMALGGVQGVLNDDGGEGFQGALALVELMLEMCDSLVCTCGRACAREPDPYDDSTALGTNIVRVPVCQGEAGGDW